VPLTQIRLEVTVFEVTRHSVKIRRGRRWDQRRRFPVAPLPANNPLVRVDLSNIKQRHPFGFSDHPGRRNYWEVLKAEHGLLLPIGAYTAVIGVAIFSTL
jgi:hypothetical protein